MIITPIPFSCHVKVVVKPTTPQLKAVIDSILLPSLFTLQKIKQSVNANLMAIK